MAKGLKLSKTAIFNIIYHFWDAESGGVSTNYPEYDEDYILGIGTDNLAQATHEYYSLDKYEIMLYVYLERFEEDINNIYNKNLKEGLFSNPIDKITDSDSGDIHLYAKWLIRYFKTFFRYYPNSPTVPGAGPYLMPDNQLIFSWSN